ncbi:MAG TPA: DNA polymerase III subunit alpha, partial [Anaerolineae bacterium]|nr:DNA polymerase III subunit alpha [Anaerolineae bacterium]
MNTPSHGIDRPFMAAHSEGIIATTGCMAGEIPRAIGAGKMELAHALLAEYLEIFGKERLFIELQEHSIPELTDINRKLIEMAAHYGLENNFLATNDTHYTRAEDADPHGVLLCVQTSSTVKNPKMRFSDKGYYVRSYEEMFQLFRQTGYDEAIIRNALQNSLRITEMCDVNLDSEGYHLPEFDVPEGYDAQSYLRALCEEGLVWRYGRNRAENDPDLRARLEHELNIIHSMGFDTYFLIVWDLCEWAARTDRWWEAHQDPFPYSSYNEWKANDIWWNVRGSGAGSVVAYTLGVTNIEPLANGLIFERFLNPGRVSMPDIDLDYPDDARHWMVAYTKRRYGSEKVAQIITFGTMGARAAIRDVGRALDMPLPEVDVVARIIPAIPGKPAHIADVLNKEHEFYSAELEERYKRETAVKELLDTARSLEGISRHASSHAAGVIISDRPLVEYVPLNRPTGGEEGLGGVDRVTQWPMEIVESIGLLKVDFLGLSTLTVMRRAARLIEERYGVKYTMDNIPYDVGHVGPDPEKKPEALFEMLERGEVAGIFQVEGSGMRRLMMEMKPRRFDHIIAAISLYRPGPMENIPEYIRRMHAAIFEDKDVVEYHTPALEPILKDTYGILVYQEQIIRIAAELAGYEPGEADMIRKAVAKKKKKLMEKHRLQFIEGAMANGFSREVCEAIWADIEFFARYGFNKCLPGDVELVDTATGRLARIEDVYNGRVVLEQTATCDVGNLKMKTGAVTAVLNNGVKPVYRLTTSLGKQIEATANHPFYTFAGWRWLGELEVGEQIALPRRLPVSGQEEWPEHEVIALGHLLAEGNLCHPHSVYFYTQHEPSLQDYVQAAGQFENVTCSVSLHRNTWSVYAKRINRQQPPGIVTWAKTLGIWGKGAAEKEIPVDAFALKNEQIALLLGRMWDGDGSLARQERGAVHA